jgi:hypothetical protein
VRCWSEGLGFRLLDVDDIADNLAYGCGLVDGHYVILHFAATAADAASHACGCGAEAYDDEAESMNVGNKDAKSTNGVLGSVFVIVVTSAVARVCIAAIAHLVDSTIRLSLASNGRDETDKDTNGNYDAGNDLCMWLHDAATKRQTGEHHANYAKDCTNSCSNDEH